LYGTSEGFLARLKTSTNNDSVGTAGYMLWSPRYHNTGEFVDPAETTQFYNVFIHSTNNSSQSPTNVPNTSAGAIKTWVDALGNNAVGAIADPAANLIGADNAVVLDARTLSACLRMTYTGRMDTAAGEVAFIENIPVSSIIGDTDQKESPVSVDELFVLSSSTQRLGVDTLEIVHRSHEVEAATFMDSKDGALWNTSFTGGLPQSPTTVSSNAVITAPHVFGFAWRNLANVAAAANLTFGLTKNVEWRPAPASGFTAVTPHTINVTNQLAIVHAQLDRSNPNWTKRILDSAGSLAGKVVRMAATGVGTFARREGANFAKRLASGVVSGLLMP
jgi:hypothetical protein